MAELDQIRITNPTDEDITTYYNGEPYSLKAREERTEPQHLARHMAKQISDREVQNEVNEMWQKSLKTKTPLSDTLRAQYALNDNMIRRRWLYRCLRHKDQVLEVLKRYPQFKGFIGEENEFDMFVMQYEEEQKGSKKEEPPTRKNPPYKQVTSYTAENPKK